MKPPYINDDEYSRELRDAPPSPQLWRLRAREALKQQRTGDAIEILQQGLRRFPAEPDLMGDLANMHLLMRDSISARPLVEILLKANGRPPESVLNYARLLWLEGAYWEALDCYQEAYARAPDERQYALRLAQAHVSLGQVQQALKLLQSWQRRGPSADMLALHVLCEFDQGGQESAWNVVVAGKQAEPSNPVVNYLYAALQMLAGDSQSAQASIALAGQSDWIRARWAGFMFALGSGGDIRFHGVLSNCLVAAISLAPAEGLVAEFGVYHGLSLIQIAKHVLGPVHGFDSFEGLPEDWKAGEPAGSYSTHGCLPQLPPQVSLHPGWFRDTVPAFVAKQRAKARFIHLDCDLYSSTRTVLEEIYPLLQTGTVLMFDEYLGFPGYEQHEFRAWHEFSQQHRIAYTHIGCTLMAKAMALRITGMGAPWALG